MQLSGFVCVSFYVCLCSLLVFGENCDLEVVVGFGGEVFSS